MGFQHGLSGLNAASRNLDVIGNNVANANTIGFKSSRAEFADLYASSLATSSGGSIGLGVNVASVTQQFAQGSITTTNNPLDVAINGGGFFRMSNNGSLTYSRNGQFQIDKSGYVVNSNGGRLTGYPVDLSGQVTTGAPTDLRISTSDLQPKPTSELSMILNLDSRKTPPTGAFQATDASTYTSASSMTIYDSQGNAHALSLYFVKGTNPNEWDVHATLDGTAVGTGAIGNLQFQADGTLDTAASSTPFSLALTLANGATFPSPLPLDFAGTTQFGTAFGVNAIKQDGYGAGKLTGISIDPSGTVLGRYSNGQTMTQGQVALATFGNNQGLAPIGGNQWVETTFSGQPMVGTPGSSNMGLLQSGALEESNVDLTQELVNMITAQRTYQANAQTIKTQDQVLQTLVNLR
jgi:flagellar hook protein FlgE